MSFSTSSEVDSVPKPICETPLSASRRTSSSLMRQRKSVDAWKVQRKRTPESRIAAAVDGEVGIQQRNFGDAITWHQRRQLTGNPLGRERVEAALVKHHVGAVIACVGA